MISPYTKHHEGSPRTAVPLRGLFNDGVWHCNCPDRLPAVKRQTKNHGVNHLRWFYTCQRDQQRRCNFFLWASDAEAREKLFVLSNSRTESSATPLTPSKSTAHQVSSSFSSGLLTPQTDQRSAKRFKPGTPLASAKARMMTEDTDDFGWDDSVESEMETLISKTPPGTNPHLSSIRQPDFGLGSRKTPHQETIMSLKKRKREDFEEDDRSVTLTPASTMATPRTDRGNGGGLHATRCVQTPTPSRYRNVTASTDSPFGSASDLAQQASEILEKHNVIVPKVAQEELNGLFNGYYIKARAVLQSRDVCRDALKRKDSQIAKLNERIANLESQRELSRALGSGFEG